MVENNGFGAQKEIAGRINGIPDQATVGRMREMPLTD